jgi:hypothetical protein
VNVFISPPVAEIPCLVPTHAAKNLYYPHVVDFIAFQAFHKPINVYKTSKKPPKGLTFGNERVNGIHRKSHGMHGK